MVQRYTDIIFINTNDEILILKRASDNDFMPDKWCFPGGHLDKGYSLEENAKKELEEETGIRAKVLTKLINWTFDDGSSTTIFVAYEDIDGFRNVEDDSVLPRLTISEHSDYKWVTLDELLEENDISDNLMPSIKDYLHEIFD